MRRTDEFRELLFADVALLQGHAEARQVAAALLKYWSTRERGGTLEGELARIAGITSSELDAIRAEVDRLVEAAAGDARRAVTLRGGLAHELHAAVSRQDAQVSRQLTELGAGIRVTLRTLPRDRYLDFMPVGEGGMGIVYWALDTELGRQVAFKVIRPPVEGAGAGVTPPAPVHMRKPAGDSESEGTFRQLEARFLQEAWVTGGMEHPGIVPVYELGRTEGGVPYYTMRFVRGRRTLETAIDDLRERGFDERVALLEPFLKVCDAIAYAHSRGVVHRDLKPANVALGDFGEAIVLDWGLAKLEGREDVHASRWQARVTDFRTETEMATVASALGTPGYMAPEAAARRVEDVDRLSDVYSLGVVLFEIVTGRLPFEFATFEEYARRLQAEDAPDAASVDPAVPSGLAALCAGALARAKARRPASVGDLAAAVRTWQKQRTMDREIDVLVSQAEDALGEIEGLSVAAMRKQSERAAVACRRVLELRPGERRARRLLERARDLTEAAARAQTRQAQRALVRRVAVGALVVLAVVGSVVAWLLEQRRREAEDAREVARKERDNAAAHRARAEEAIGFITEELRAALEPEGRLDVLAQIGEKARAHFASIPVRDEGAKSFRQRMRALRQLGEVYLAQGNLPQARAVFEEAVAAGDAHAEAGGSSELARFERGRAHINLARVDHAQGYPRRGSKRVRSVVEQLARGCPPGIEPIEYDVVRVQALNALTRALRGTSDHAEARATSERALALARDLLDHEAASRAHRKLAIETALFAAVTRFSDGDAEGALREAEDAVSDAEALHGSHPDDLTLEALAVRSARVAAFILRYTERFERAERLLGAVLPRARALVAERPDNFLWRDQLMNVLFLLGDARAGTAQAAWKAPEIYAEAYALAEALHAHDPSHATWAFTLVNLCDRRAQAAGPPGRVDPQVRLGFRRRAAEFARKLSALEPGNTRWRYLLAFTLGTLADLLPDSAEALALLREAYGHNRYALERVPAARDVNDFFLTLTGMIMLHTSDPAAKIEVARETFATYLRVAGEHADAYWAVHHVSRTVTGLAARLVRLGPDGAAETRRQAEAALAFLEALGRREPPPPDDIARELESWKSGLAAARDAAGG